jgi:hypothetical protein
MPLLCSSEWFPAGRWIDSVVNCMLNDNSY